MSSRLPFMMDSASSSLPVSSPPWRPKVDVKSPAATVCATLKAWRSGSTMLRVTSQAVTSEKSTASALSASIMLRAVAYS
ncbi:hypothetical protein D3C81_1517520 [compost metagenome]